MSHIVLKSSPNKNKFHTGSDAMCQYLVYQVTDKLSKLYKDHMWQVSMSTDRSVITIKCPTIISDYGYVLHTTTVQNDTALSCVAKAGGELLERAYLDREGFQRGKEAEKFDLGDIEFKRIRDRGNTHRIVT